MIFLMDCIAVKGSKGTGTTSLSALVWRNGFFYVYSGYFFDLTMQSKRKSVKANAFWWDDVKDYLAKENAQFIKQEKCTNSNLKSS